MLNPNSQDCERRRRLSPRRLTSDDELCSTPGGPAQVCSVPFTTPVLKIGDSFTGSVASSADPTDDEDYKGALNANNEINEDTAAIPTLATAIYITFGNCPNDPEPPSDPCAGLQSTFLQTCCFANQQSPSCPRRRGLASGAARKLERTTVSSSYLSVSPSGVITLPATGTVSDCSVVFGPISLSSVPAGTYDITLSAGAETLEDSLDNARSTVRLIVGFDLQLQVLGGESLIYQRDTNGPYITSATSVWISAFGASTGATAPDFADIFLKFEDADGKDVTNAVTTVDVDGVATNGTVSSSGEVRVGRHCSVWT